MANCLPQSSPLPNFARSVYARRLRPFANWRSALFLTLAGLPLSPAVHADEIILKNGKIIQGSARISGDRVIIQPWDSGASIVLDRERIETIIPKESEIQSFDQDPSLLQEEAGALSKQSEDETLSRHDAANVRMSKPHFRLNPSLPRITYSYEPAVPDAQIRMAVESVFPRIVSICVSELGLTLDQEIALNIQIIEDLASFEEQKTRNSDLHYAVEAYYSVEEDKIFVWGNEFRQKMVASIYHEGIHALLRREFTTVPSWIDEGLAEFFEGFRAQGNAIVGLTPQYNNGWAKRFLLEDQFIPLHDYLRLTNHQWVEIDQRSQNMARITAWSLVTYLMESEVGRQGLRRYLQALKRGAPAEALAKGYQELDAAYPGGIARLERDWRSWILEERKAQTF